MANEWYFQAKGRRFGPISAGLMRQQVEAGRIVPETLVRKGDEGKWIAATKVRGLFDSDESDESGESGEISDPFTSPSNGVIFEFYPPESPVPPPPPSPATDLPAKDETTTSVERGPQPVVASRRGCGNSEILFNVTMVLLVLIGLTIVGLLTFDETQTRTGIRDKIVDRPQWEYTIESPDDLFIEDELERLGAQGWELVFARRATSDITDGVSYEMIFKRRRPAAGGE